LTVIIVIIFILLLLADKLPAVHLGQYIRQLPCGSGSIA